MLTRNHEDRDAAQTCLKTSRPGILKINAIDFGNDINAQRWNADLQDCSCLAQVINREIAKRGAKIRERAENLFRIFPAWLHPHIQVLRRAYVSVRGQSMRSYDQILNVVRVEGE